MGHRRVWVIPALIFAAVLAPLVLAVLVYEQPSWFPLARTNHGQLVRPPVKVHAAALPRMFARGKLSSRFFRGHWTLVYIGPAHCARPCKLALYATRQARLAAGAQMRRVQRLYVVRGADSDARRYVSETQPDLVVVSAHGAAGRTFVRQFAAVRPPGGIYMVDPNGLLMMTYATGADPSGLLKDLRHLLNANESE